MTKDEMKKELEESMSNEKMLMEKVVNLKQLITRLKKERDENDDLIAENLILMDNKDEIIANLQDALRSQISVTQSTLDLLQ